MKPQLPVVMAFLLVSLVCIVSAVSANPVDIYPDNKVDWLDLKVLFDNWLSDGNTPADIDSSGDVNGVDFAICLAISVSKYPELGQIIERWERLSVEKREKIVRIVK